MSAKNGTTYHLTLKSSNEKTGPIPVSTTSWNTCPSACSFNNGNGCYAASGPLAIHWKAVSNGSRGTDLKTFTEAISNLPDGTLWRHNQAGDLPGTDNAIDAASLNLLVRANRGKRGFTYTHKPLTGANKKAIKLANSKGFTINVSTDNVSQADQAKHANVGPVVTVCSSDTTDNFRTPAGHLVVICPAVVRDNVNCATCKLCAWVKRDVIIGFPAHGSRKSTVDSLIQIGGTK
jgi:hypothetical protein